LFWDEEPLNSIMSSSAELYSSTFSMFHILSICGQTWLIYHNIPVYEITCCCYYLCGRNLFLEITLETSV
jgi:hypothetical protein